MKTYSYEMQVKALLESDTESATLIPSECETRLSILSDIVELFFLQLFSTEKINADAPSHALEAKIKSFEIDLRRKMIRLALSEPTLINQYNMLKSDRRDSFQKLVKHLISSETN